ncbi:MAG TPA: hypothetical protein VFQ35_13715 [Polyangiaceae bacterium]|nr:hypothetical protein [Polyangiaceae bacterium]
MRRALLLPWPLLLACAGPHLRGASAIEREKEPHGSERATLVTRDCRDERGAPAAQLDLELVYLDPSGGPRRLLERRTDHDSVLVENTYEDGGAHVFVYVSADVKHRDVLHRVRLAPDGMSGELSFSRDFSVKDSEKGFRAETSRIALRCALVPLEARE